MMRKKKLIRDKIIPITLIKYLLKIHFNPNNNNNSSIEDNNNNNTNEHISLLLCKIKVDNLKINLVFNFLLKQLCKTTKTPKEVLCLAFQTIKEEEDFNSHSQSSKNNRIINNLIIEGINNKTTPNNN